MSLMGSSGLELLPHERGLKMLAPKGPFLKKGSLEGFGNEKEGERFFFYP